MIQQRVKSHTSKKQKITSLYDIKYLIMSVSTYISTGRRGTSFQVGMDTRADNVESVSVGDSTGKRAGDGSVCIGFEAGQDCSSGAVCIGYSAGYESAGTNNIIIGRNAMSNSSPERNSNVIVLNATGSDSINPHGAGLFIKPIRKSGGTTYFRSIDYIGTPPDSYINSSGGSLILGSFTIDPSSVCNAITLTASIPFVTLRSDNIPGLATGVLAILDPSNTVIYSQNISFPTTPNGETIQVYDLSQTALTASLFNTGATSKTFSIRLTNTTVPVALQFGQFDSSIALYRANGNLQTSVHLNGRFTLPGTVTLPELRYEITSGEITYSTT